MESLGGWKGIDTTYLRSLKDHTSRYPSLKLLNTPSYVPEYITRIKILEFNDNNGISEFEIRKLGDLAGYWNPPTVPVAPSNELPPPKLIGRIYLVEDISLPYINLLGSHYSIDPRFFVSYLNVIISVCL